MKTRYALLVGLATGALACGKAKTTPGQTLLTPNISPKTAPSTALTDSMGNEIQPQICIAGTITTYEAGVNLQVDTEPFDPCGLNGPARTPQLAASTAGTVTPNSYAVITTTTIALDPTWVSKQTDSVAIADIPALKSGLNLSNLTPNPATIQFQATVAEDSAINYAPSVIIPFENAVGAANVSINVSSRVVSCVTKNKIDCQQGDYNAGLTYESADPTVGVFAMTKAQLGGTDGAGADPSAYFTRVFRPTVLGPGGNGDTFVDAEASLTTLLPASKMPVEYDFDMACVPDGAPGTGIVNPPGGATPQVAALHAETAGVGMLAAFNAVPMALYQAKEQTVADPNMARAYDTAWNMGTIVAGAVVAHERALFTGQGACSAADDTTWDTEQIGARANPNQVMIATTALTKPSLNAAGVTSPGASGASGPTGSLLPGTEYQYEITAVDALGDETDPALAVTTLANAVDNPGTSDYVPGNDEASLNWAPVIGATSYRIYGRGLPNSNGVTTFGFIIELDATNNTWLDDGSMNPGLKAPPTGNSTELPNINGIDIDGEQALNGTATISFAGTLPSGIDPNFYVGLTGTAPVPGPAIFEGAEIPVPSAGLSLALGGTTLHFTVVNGATSNDEIFPFPSNPATYTNLDDVVKVFNEKYKGGDLTAMVQQGALVFTTSEVGSQVVLNVDDDGTANAILGLQAGWANGTSFATNDGIYSVADITGTFADGIFSHGVDYTDGKILILNSNAVAQTGTAGNLSLWGGTYSVGLARFYIQSRQAGAPILYASTFVNANVSESDLLNSEVGGGYYNYVGSYEADFPLDVTSASPCNNTEGFDGLTNFSLMAFTKDNGPEVLQVYFDGNTLSVEPSSFVDLNACTGSGPTAVAQ